GSSNRSRVANRRARCGSQRTARRPATRSVSKRPTPRSTAGESKGTGAGIGTAYQRDYSSGGRPSSNQRLRKRTPVARTPSDAPIAPQTSMSWRIACTPSPRAIEDSRPGVRRVVLRLALHPVDRDGDAPQERADRAADDHLPYDLGAPAEVH